LRMKDTPNPLKGAVTAVEMLPVVILSEAKNLSFALFMTSCFQLEMLRQAQHDNSVAAHNPTAVIAPL
jgi:hypothetical protein